MADRFPLRRPANPLDRPERSPPENGPVDRAIMALRGLRGMGDARRDRGVRRLLAGVEALADELAGVDDATLKNRVKTLQGELAAHGLTRQRVVTGFALIRESARRTLGMFHHPNQLMAGWVLLTGRVAELATGEGKTLVATLPAAMAALAGIPVHVVTVNDYLTRRDAELMTPLYSALGLRVGVVAHGMSPQQRRAAYRCDITYCTNNELVFDYLKDGLQMPGGSHPLDLHTRRLQGERVADALLLRGLHFGVVDEADSVLVDEARTPLIISGSAETHRANRDTLSQALELAGALTAGSDFQVNQRQRLVRLTPAGQQRLAALAEPHGAFWSGRLRREDLVRQALSALHLFQRDRHYLVHQGKVVIVDEHTGRPMPDRSWNQGLHQLVECKEGVKITTPNKTLARISYQRFFRKFHHLGGMTGTAAEVSGELWRVYGLPSLRIPTHRPCQRRDLGQRVFRGGEEKWRAVAAEVAALHERGMPVLVGTTSVAASEALGERLMAAGIPHQVLNAKQDQREAEIIARAGGAGRVTIATSMAGRGTDIALTPEAKTAGGLHVLLTELHEAGRIDRQLVGRSARQGDPGAWLALLSLEDGITRSGGGPLAPWLLPLLQRLPDGMPGAGLARLWLLQHLQWQQERRHARVRAQLLTWDEQQAQMLAFAAQQ